MSSQKFKNSSLKENKTKSNMINSAKIQYNKMIQEMAIKYNMTIEEVKEEVKEELNK